MACFHHELSSNETQKRNIWIWYASPCPIVQVRCGGGSRGRQSGGRVGDVGPKARWQDEHRCMVKSGSWNWRDEKDRRLLFNGHLFIIWFFVLCILLRCGLDIQWHPASDFCCESLLCQEPALSIWLWCEFHRWFIVKASQVKRKIVIPSGCLILLYTMLHVFAQYVSCFMIFKMFHLTSPVPICLILLSNYHAVSRQHPNRHSQSLHVSFPRIIFSCC